jgi:hypothetical protein
LTLGCRTITKDDGICNKEFFGVPPPFMAAGTAAEIAARIEQLCNDPDDTAGIGASGVDWIHGYHSGGRFVALQETQFARLAPQPLTIEDESDAIAVPIPRRSRITLRDAVRSWLSKSNTPPPTA